MGWLLDEFERAHVRRFRRSIVDAAEALTRLPPVHREQLAREMQEAADQALRLARAYRR